MIRLRSPVVLLVLAGALVRLYLLFASNWMVEGDEAAVGLQALAILRGERPLFYPGQAYLGNLESYLTALVFAAVGPSRYALKTVPFIFALAFIALCCQLGKTVFRNERTGRMAALLAAIAPVYVVLWSVKARGGYIEALVLSQLAWLWLWRAGDRAYPHTGRAAIIGGFVAGFVLWMNPIALYVLAPLLLLTAARLVRAGLREPGAVLRAVTLAAIGALLGLAPILLYRAAYGDAPLGILTKLPPFRSWGDITAQAWRYFWLDGVTVLTGLRLPKDRPFVPDWRLLAAPIYALAVVAAALRARRSAAHMLLLLGAFVAFPIFTFGTLSGENFAALIPDSGLLTRYLLPLALLFVLALGDLISRLPRVPAVAVAGTVLCVNLFGIAAADGVALARNEFANQPLPADYSDVIARLRQRGLSHVYTNHWIGYLLTLESGEQIATHDYTDTAYGMDRFPLYSRRVLAATDPALVVFNPHVEPNPIDARLRVLGIAFRKEELESFLIYFAFTPPVQMQALDEVLQYPYY